jgi:quinol monooxygenase YgiN
VIADRSRYSISAEQSAAADDRCSTALRGSTSHKRRSLLNNGVGFQSNEGLVQYVLIIHEVADYAAWKAVFDQAAQIRKEAGEISYQLLRKESDANQVVHFSRWSSLAEARRFFESPEVSEIRRKAGVKAPEFIYLHELEHGNL